MTFKNLQYGITAEVTRVGGDYAVVITDDASGESSSAFLFESKGKALTLAKKTVAWHPRVLAPLAQFRAQ